MFNSLKMVRLDFFTFKSQIISYATLVLIIIMFSVMGSSFSTLSITVSWFVTLLSMNIFAIQEKNELERLYASLSFDLKEIISGRYIFVLINYVFAMILSGFIGVAGSVLQNRNVEYTDIIFGICISLLMFTVIIGIQMPIYFELGYTKGRVWCLIPFVSVMLIFSFPSFIDVFSSIAAELAKHQMVLEMMCVIISFAILPVSYHLSVKCYRKRR